MSTMLIMKGSAVCRTVPGQAQANAGWRSLSGRVKLSSEILRLGGFGTIPTSEHFCEQISRRHPQLLHHDALFQTNDRTPQAQQLFVMCYTSSPWSRFYSASPCPRSTGWPTPLCALSQFVHPFTEPSVFVRLAQYANPNPCLQPNVIQQGPTDVWPPRSAIGWFSMQGCWTHLLQSNTAAMLRTTTTLRPKLRLNLV